MGFRAKKELGQHFLKDRNIAAKIAGLGYIKPGEEVWEIGPGRGILTRELLEFTDKVTAFEIDEELYPVIEEAFGDRINLVKRDVLRVDWDEMIGKENIKIVANIPYQITSPLIIKTINFREHVDVVVIMIQKEVAERLRAKPSCKEYSFLTIKTQFYFDVKYEFTVKPHLFFPKPKVESAVVSLYPKAEIPYLAEPEKFWEVVNASFRSRRKTLRNNMKYILSNVQIAELEKVSEIDLVRRAETLTIPEFVDLYNLVRFL
jgi:16S rRNA (adenine1518-N6/adenine1519-N6)-dimethyltransferase